MPEDMDTVIGMAAITLEATIEDGRIILDEPEKLPKSGRVFVEIFEESSKTVDLDALEKLMEKMTFPMDGLEYERQIREEWSERDRLNSNPP